MTSKWLTPLPHNIPKDLILDDDRLPRCDWVVWKIELRDGKPAKIPFQPRNPLKRAASNRPYTWAGFSQALDAYKHAKMCGVGIIVPPGFVGLDFDKCVANGVIEQWAQYLVDAFDSYTELSPSGTGLRVWLRGSMPGPRCRTGRIEMYDCNSPRYLTVTGHIVRNRPIANRQATLCELYTSLFNHDVADVPEQCEASRPRHVVHHNEGEVDEATVWTVIADLASSKTKGERFVELFCRGDLSKNNEDRSSGDLALCRLLAWHCGYDPDLMDAVFRKSALYRVKWDRPDYKTRTLQKALDGREPFWIVSQQAQKIINKE